MMISKFLKASLLFQVANNLFFLCLYGIHFGFTKFFQIVLFAFGIEIILIVCSLLLIRFRISSAENTLNQMKNELDKGKYLKKFAIELTLVSSLSAVLSILMTIVVASKQLSVFDSMGHLAFFVGMGLFIGIAFGILTYNHFLKLFSNQIPRDTLNAHIQKLSIKFVLPVISTVIFTNIIVGFFVYQYVYSSKLNDSGQILHESSDAHAKTAQSIIEVPLDELRALANIFDSHFVKEVNFSRKDVQAIFKNYLKARPDLLGVWYGFEPNAFDGNDATNRNKDTYDSSGRMMGYFYFYENKIKSEGLHNYTIPGKGDFYLGPIKSGKEMILGPYVYESNSGAIQMISLVIPVIQNGKPVGVVGIDLTIDYITKRFPNDNGLETILLSTDNIIVVSPNLNHIGRQVSEVDQNLASNVTQFQDKTNVFLEYRDDKTREMFNAALVKVIIGSSESDWKSIAIAKKSEIQKETEKVSYIIFILIIIICLVVGYIVILTANPLAKSLNLFLNNFVAVREGDLTVRCNELAYNNNREVATLAYSFNEFLAKLSNAIGLIQKHTDFQVTLLTEFSSQSEELASSSQNQAASVEETTAALEEISASVESIAQSADDQSKIADETLRSSSEQHRLLESLMTITNEGAEQSANTFVMAEKGNLVLKNTSSSMNRIETSTQKIEEMVTYIQEISDQVNLLALNAAIEAARAGEQGRGFAVVASEIGKLADKTQANTKQISELVSQGITDTRLGSVSVQETESIFSEILRMTEKTKMGLEKVNSAISNSKEESIRNLEYSRKLKDLSENIALSTSEQKTSNDEILRSVSSINESTQSIAMSADEITRKAQETKEKLTVIKEEISYYKV